MTFGFVDRRSIQLSYGRGSGPSAPDDDCKRHEADRLGRSANAPSASPPPTCPRCSPSGGRSTSTSGRRSLLEGDPPALEELLDHVEGRLGLVPRFRQRVKSAPLGLVNPVWVDDPRFDLGWHVRHTAPAAPRDHGAAPRAGRPGDVRAAGPPAAPVAALSGRGPGGRPPRLHLEDPPRARRRRLGGRRGDDHARPEPRGHRAPDRRGALGPRRAEPGDALRPRRLGGDPGAAARRPQGGAQRAHHAPRHGVGRHAHRGGVRQPGGARAERRADLPQPGDRPRPPGRLRERRAGGG